MSPISVDDFFGFAKSLVGADLVTLTDSKPFKLLEVSPAEIRFQISTGNVRRATRPYIEKFCDRYSRTRLTKTNAYKDIDRNASYWVAIADKYEKQARAQSLETEILQIAEERVRSRYYEPESSEKALKRIWREIAERRGQSSFRKQLLEAYVGRCAVTRCRAREVLEAAHIKPFCEKQTFSVDNGLLLRADIHTLFDLNLIGINPNDLTVAVATSIASPNYRKLHGKCIFQPKVESLQPSKDLLRDRWQDFCANS